SSRASGFSRRQPETWKKSPPPGFSVTRPAYESSAPWSRSQRFSSGSAPWNSDPSTVTTEVPQSAVTTSSEMWVESRLWCDSGAIGIAAGGAQGALPLGLELHEQVVRVLPVDEQIPLVGLAALEEERAPFQRHRRRL